MLTSEKIVESIHKCVNACENELTTRYTEALSVLKPGEAAPEKRVFRHDYEKAEYFKKGAALKEEALAPIKAKVAAAQAQAVAAPSQDALNYITALSASNYITEPEINYAMETYGKNYSCAKLIEEIARKHDILVFSPNLDLAKANEQLRIYEDLQKVLDPREIYANVSNGWKSFYSWYISSTNLAIFD